MSDLISRQAAIDAIYAEFEYVYCFNCDHEGNEEWCEDCHRKYMKWSASRNTIERVLNGLPSAEPEIIRCKDCKWYGRADKRRFYRGMDCLKKRIDTIVPDRDFCSRAERRTDATD